MTLSTQEQLNKLADAAFAVEEYILQIAQTRNLEACELGISVIALLLKRMGDSNGSDMTKQILADMTDAVEKQGAK